jgi:predicted PurR-regulated permease PerM
MNKIKNIKFKNNILLATYVVVLAYVLLNLSTVSSAIGIVFSIVKPFIIAVAIAFVLNLPMKFIEEKLLTRLFNKINIEKLNIIKRPLALVLTLLSVFGIIAAIIVFVLPQLFESGATLINNIPGYIGQLQTFMIENFKDQQIFENLYSKVLSMGEEILKLVGNMATSFAGEIINITIGVTSTIVNFILALITAIYVLLSKEKLAKQFKKILFAYFSQDKVKKIISLGRLTNDKFSKYVTGQCIEACILGGLCFIGMSIFNMPYPLLISTIIGVTALIPIFGAFIGLMPGIFIILMIDPITALWFVVLVIVIQQIEGNIIYPFVVGNSVGLSALWVLVAITIGGNGFGVLGMIIGLPLFGVIYTIFVSQTNKRLIERNIDIDKVELTKEVIVKDNKDSKE